MKRLSVVFLAIFAIISVSAQKLPTKTGLGSLTKEERNAIYKPVNDRDNFNGGKIPPEWAYIKLLEYIMNMTATSDLATSIQSPTDTSKEYLDYVFKYYNYDLMREYFAEIKAAYAKLLTDAPRIEVDNVKRYMTDLATVGSNSLIHRIQAQQIYDIERDAPKEANIAKTGNEDDFRSVEETAALFQTWDDFFMGENRNAGIAILGKLHIREWLTYEVEYCLPMAMLPEYRMKLETFLKKFGL